MRSIGVQDVTLISAQGKSLRRSLEPRAGSGGVVDTSGVEEIQYRG